MRFVLLRAGVSAVAIIVLLCMSCEKHHVGEYPEVQRDRLAEARQARQTEQGDVPAASATPVKFFPEKKSR